MQTLNISLKVIPSSSRDEVVGWLGEGEARRLKVKTRVAPENGKANKAIEQILAKHLGLTKKQVKIIEGLTSQRKTAAISVDAEGLITVSSQLSSL